MLPVIRTAKRAFAAVDRGRGHTLRPEQEAQNRVIPRASELAGPELRQLVDRLSFVSADALIADLPRQAKPDVLRALIRKLTVTRKIPAEMEDELVGSLIKRETLASTGIGQGVGIPHTKHAGVDRVIGAVAWCQEGLQFESLDDEPVHLVVLVISPADRHAEHLQALASVSSILLESRETAGNPSGGKTT
jgi:PTS system fructose-specific IIA component/PTS system nitrogen regulatory IIA component